MIPSLRMMNPVPTPRPVEPPRNELTPGTRVVTLTTAGSTRSTTATTGSVAGLKDPDGAARLGDTATDGVAARTRCRLSVKTADEVVHEPARTAPATKASAASRAPRAGEGIEPGIPGSNLPGPAPPPPPPRA